MIGAAQAPSIEIPMSDVPLHRDENDAVFDSNIVGIPTCNFSPNRDEIYYLLDSTSRYTVRIDDFKPLPSTLLSRLDTDQQIAFP